MENAHEELTKILQRYSEDCSNDHGENVCNVEVLGCLSDNAKHVLLELHSMLSTGEDSSELDENGRMYKVLQYLVAFGPSGAPANVLVFDEKLLFKLSNFNIELDYQPFVDKINVLNTIWRQFSSDRLLYPLTVGFHSTCNSGPLMQEPIHGVCFVIEKIELSCNSVVNIDWNGVSTIHDIQSVSIPNTISFIPIQSGIIISDFMDMCACLMLSYPMRVYEPIYKCDIQCDASVLSSLYGVIFKRRSTIVSENIIEGTSLFILTVHLPVVESFGFALELLKKTSGKGTNTSGGDVVQSNNLLQSPQLSYSHWSLLTQDPFWRPTTVEELEMYGDLSNNSSRYDQEGSKVSNSAVISRRIIDSVRVRKGLPIENKIIGEADKQRTLSKKK